MSRTLLLVANAGESTITTFGVDGTKLVTLATSPTPGPCSTFAYDPVNQLVLAGCKGTPPVIAALHLQTDGSLHQVSHFDVPASPVYLTLLDGLLLSASYQGDRADAWPISGTTHGSITSTIKYAKLHSIVTDPTARHVYAVSLGQDLIAQYELTSDKQLRPLFRPVVEAPSGSGPRHLVIDRTGLNAYLVTEFSGEVIRYARDPQTGALSRGESVSIVDPGAGLKHSRIGADPLAESLIWGADIQLSGDRRWLFATERTASTIATVSLTPDGHLGEVVALRGVETQPRGFAVSATGSLVAVAGEISGQVGLHQVDDQGQLSEVDRQPSGARANWTRFIDLP